MGREDDLLNRGYALEYLPATVHTERGKSALYR